MATAIVYSPQRQGTGTLEAGKCDKKLETTVEPGEGWGGIVRGGGGREEKMRRSSHFCEFETTEIKILAFTRFVDWEVASLTDALLARHAIFPAQVAT